MHIKYYFSNSIGVYQYIPQYSLVLRITYQYIYTEISL